MPWFMKSNKNNLRENNESRQRYEKQMHLAMHAPDAIVDVSRCSLENLPDEVVNTTKVLLKQVLDISSNRLSNLCNAKGVENLSVTRHSLRKLNASNNNIKHFPSSIAALVNLQVLNLSHNQLKDITPEIANLTQLESLDIQDNKITTLPSAIGCLTRLCRLIIKDNRITSLPSTLNRLNMLSDFECDAHAMIEPSSDICIAGIEAIKEYFGPTGHCEDIATAPAGIKTKSPSYVDPYEAISRTASQIHSLRNERSMNNAISEKQLMDQYAEHAKLLANQSANRVDLLNKLAEDQAKDKEIITSHTEKQNAQREQMQNDLLYAEKRAQALIADIIATNKKFSESEKILEEAQMKQMNEDSNLQAALDNLTNQRKMEIHHQMVQQLNENKKLDELSQLAQASKNNTINAYLESEMNIGSQIDESLKSRKQCFDHLTNEINNDMQLQMAAVLSLMESRDVKRNRINQQINDIMAELASLSHAEYKNKQERLYINNEILENERAHLLQMILSLFDEKEKRSQELTKQLIEMDRQREDTNVDYWMVRYTMLMNSMPAQVSSIKLSSDLRDLIDCCQCEQFELMLVRNHITTVRQLAELNDEHLMRIGVHSVGARQRLLQAALDHIASKKKLEDMETVDNNAVNADTVSVHMAPSAPSQRIVEAHFEVECVICLDQKATILFIPCGHVCACAQCALIEKLLLCPLCRQAINSKIDVDKSLQQPSAPNM